MVQLPLHLALQVLLSAWVLSLEPLQVVSWVRLPSLSLSLSVADPLVLGVSLAWTSCPAEDEVSLLTGGFGSGAFGVGRALALACSAANPDKRKVSHAAASSFATPNGDPSNPAVLEPRGPQRRVQAGCSTQIQVQLTR